MLTFTNLQTQVTFAHGNRSDISSHVPIWINWAYKWAWNKLQNRGMHGAEDVSTGNCVSAQKYISVPSGTFSVMRVVVNSVTLEKRPWDEYTKITTWPSAAPTKYYIWGTTIFFDTAPDSTYAYSIYRIKNLTELSSGSDTMGLPDAFESPVISQAIAYGYRALNLPQDASYWFTSAKIDFDNAIKAYPEETEDAAWNIGFQNDEEDTD